MQQDYIREIRSITFGTLSTSDILKMSVCKVENTKLSGHGSVYDERMGPSLDVSKQCVTCGGGTDVCPGHFGHIVLNQPIIHPLFYKYVVGFLRCFCDECYKLILPYDYMSMYKLDRLGVEARFDAVQKASEKIDACCNCGKIQPKVALIPTDNTIVRMHKIQQDENSTAKVATVQMTVDEILRIFDGISDDDVRMLGFNPAHTHPRNLVMSVFPVIPSCSRPFIVADGNICDDDLTNQLCEIVKANKQLLNEPSDIKMQKALQSLKFRIQTFYDNSKGRSKHTTSGRAIKGLKERLTSKDGLLRNNLMGKRVNQSARTVIGPDPSLKMDEVGIPNEICDVLTIPEIVNATNFEKLTKIVNSGGANIVVNNAGKNINLAYATFKRGTDLLYGDIVIRPNGNRVKIGDDSKFILNQGDKVIRNGVLLEGIKYAEKRKYNLEIGNVVHRKLMNGDWVLLNRQPTLHKGSMMAVKVVRLPGKSIRFNLEKCKSYNADFDGDEMNIHVPGCYESMIELEELSSVKQNIITPQSSKPNITIIQDTLLGAYKMTKGWNLIPKDRFFQVLSFLPASYVTSKIQHIRKTMIKLGYKPMAFTGKGLMSVLLPDDFHYNSKNNASEEEPIVKIYNGVIYAGVLTKENLGSSYNSFITIINKEYGVDRVTEFINNIQFLVNNWLVYSGFTVGIGDCLATNKEQIEDTIQKCFIEAKGIEESTRNPYIREAKITACLSKAKDIGMKIAKEALKSDNNFVSTVTSGSKGDYFNIAQLTGLLGQQNLGGKRIPKMLNRGKRTMPHYPLDEPLSIEAEFESRGFIKSSFIHGLNPIEFYMHAITGREGVTDTAMGTARSGYIQRKIVKCMEDIQVKYDGTVRDASGMVYQCTYGETGIDPVSLVKTSKGGMDCCDISRIVNKLNQSVE